MTHEELLNKLEEESDFGWVAFALRAVVELHKPALTDYPSYCLHCETYGSIVPCPTIQATEKELS